MANKTLFSSIKSLVPRTDSYNESGGRAYKFTPKHALAQMAATGCFNGVYYASAQSQLDEMRKLIDHQTKFVASVMGGPVVYTDDALQRLHAHLDIDQPQFNEMTVLLRETLEDFELDSADIDEIMEHFHARSRYIVSS